MNINHNLSESDIRNIEVKPQLEHQIQFQETEENGWIFDKNNSMKIGFCKTRELNRSSYDKIPLSSNSILNIEKKEIMVNFSLFTSL